MFCKWCGIKRKGVENQCSNCKMPFDPLVSSGVPKGFPYQLHTLNDDNNKTIIKVESEKGDFQEESEDNSINDPAKTEKNLLYQNRILKITVSILLVLLLIATVSILFLKGQLVKKDDKSDDIINSEDTSVMSIDESGHIETKPSESASFSDNHDFNVNKATETEGNNNNSENGDDYEVEENMNVSDTSEDNVGESTSISDTSEDDVDESINTSNTGEDNASENMNTYDASEDNAGESIDTSDTDDGDEVDVNAETADIQNDDDESGENTYVPSSEKSDGTFNDDTNVEGSITTEKVREFRNEEGVLDKGT